MGYRNCLDYLAQWGDTPLRQRPFCEIDSLILSICAYAPLEGVLPGDDLTQTLPFYRALPRLTARRGWDHTGPLMSHQIPRLVERAAQSRRFADIPLGCLRSFTDQVTAAQFAAVTWFLPDGTLYLAFRGTDDTLVGWKESFRMAISAPIPAQALAADYLKTVAACHPGRLRLGGHSKGGSLALWAALQAPAPVRRRVLRVSCFDSPGLLYDFTRTPAYRALAPRLSAVSPQSSLVGALLHSQCQIIRSHGMGTVGQHDPFTWELEDDHFLFLPQRAPRTQRAAQTLHAWLTKMSPREQEDFVDILFDLLSAGRRKTLSDLTEAPAGSALTVIKAYRNLTEAQRQDLHGALKHLLESL